MNGEWTYANLNGEWEHESYYTKEDAVQAGRLEFNGEFLVGQLNGDDEELEYLVENIEEIE
ncbi:hypothetical protein AF332_11515 [Sporosarcina globispora]|uniref:Uncharacterized protein n=1 Tax=Sporosarcina globispora TaxID=1459 RepID=A0A0M0GD86_SPOGL|nr:hypothetical protein [Sporosarcina globispora]KON87391.1 hypothetical protein AF332_11515 [Sporosarcina globispora]